MSPARLAGVLVSVGVVLALGGAFLAGNLLGDVEPTAAAPRPEDPASSTSGGMATSGTLAPPVGHEARVVLEEPVPLPSPPGEGVREKLERLSGSVELPSTGLTWEEAYRLTPSGELQRAIREIEDVIFQATQEEFEYRFSIGMGVETIDTGPVYEAKDLDPTAVYWVRIHPGGPVQKVTLPPEEFPEVYELKALSARLRGELDKRQGGVADR